MKFNLSFMRFSKITDHHEITTKVIEADKIILDTKGKRYEIGIRELHDKESFAFPNQFIRCLIITESKGKKTVQGFFSKINLYIDPHEHFLGIVSIEEIFYRKDVDKYFAKRYKEDKPAEKIDVQTISIEDFLIQSRISMMKEARMLYKRRKNVK